MYPLTLMIFTLSSEVPPVLISNTIQTNHWFSFADQKTNQSPSTGCCVNIKMMRLHEITPNHPKSNKILSHGSQDFSSLWGASPSQVPRLPAPGDPRATPRSPHRARLGRRASLREAPEEAQPCQQMAQLLATFTKRFLVNGVGKLGRGCAASLG